MEPNGKESVEGEVLVTSPLDLVGKKLFLLVDEIFYSTSF